MSDFNRNDYLDAIQNNAAAIRPTTENTVETTARVNRLHEMINAGERVAFPAEQLPALVKNFTIGRAMKVDGTAGGDWALINGQEGKRGRTLSNFSEVRAMLNLILDLRTGRYPYTEIGLHIFYSPTDLRGASSLDRVALVKSSYAGELAAKIIGLSKSPDVVESTGNEYLDLTNGAAQTWHEVNWRNGQFIIGKTLHMHPAVKGEPEAVTAQRRTIVKHDMLDLLITGDPLLLSWSGWKDNFVATFVENMGKSIDEIKQGRVEGIVRAQARVKTAQVFSAVEKARENGTVVPGMDANFTVKVYGTEKTMAVKDLAGESVLIRRGEIPTPPSAVRITEDNSAIYGRAWAGDDRVSVQIM